MINQLDSQQFKSLGPTTWDDIFATWRTDEAHQSRWVEHFQSRGFDSWDQWRGHYTTQLKLDTRNWHRYQINQPLDTVPTFWGGPFETWRRLHYGTADTLTFAQLAQLPAIQTNEVVNQLSDDFPQTTQLIGLYQERGIIILEGMHRCCAIALAAHRSQPITSTITLALTDFSQENILPLTSATNA